MVWAADNTVWLLPAYTFGSADGGAYSVIAVEDAYIHEADPVADGTTIKPAIDPTAVSGTVLPGLGRGSAPAPDVPETVPTP
jgi:hypothetical protein